MRWLALSFLIVLLAGCEHLPVGDFGTMQDPNQAGMVTAEFRHGQTFLTWNEVAKPGMKYNIYRSRLPIETPEDLTKDNLLATVNDQTSLNLMASINRTKFNSLPPGQPYSLENRIYYVIEDGMAPLPDTTGLFVYTVQKFGQAFYAVTAVENGVENRNLYALSDGNVTRKAVHERIQAVQPVKQNATDYVHWTDDTGTRYYPAMSSVPGLAYNFRVHAPAVQGQYPVIGVLHAENLQFNTEDRARYAKLDGPEGDSAIRVALDSPVIQAKDANGQPRQIQGLGPVAEWPFEGWYGYNNHFFTGKPLEQGKDEDYTIRRVIWTLEWAAKEFGGDENRIALRGESMGGTGALQIGLLRPEKFAAIHAYTPVVSVDEESFPKQLRINPADYVLKNSSKNFPYLIFTAGRADTVVKWQWKKNFIKVLEQAKVGFSFYWDGREHYYSSDPTFRPVWGEPGGPMMKSLTAFASNQSFPALSYLRANSDVGTVDFAVEPSRRPMPNVPGTGNLVGTVNGVVDYLPESIVDKPGRYEVTLALNQLADVMETRAHVTPRRTQNFKPSARSKVSYRVVDIVSNTVIDQGRVVVEDDGLVQVPNVAIHVGGTRLEVTK